MPLKLDLNQFLVQGRIISQDGTPRPGLTVKAFDRNVGAADILLGQATTDQQGNYQIYYTLGQLGGKPAANLVIRVYQDNKLLQESDVIFDAQPRETKDFVIPLNNSNPVFSDMAEKINKFAP